ncbi:MAG: sulfatase-like hydrolase/transferase [Pseudomonadales bacterium]|nr:sulfatase-like hydrolase/transferase [Pseudomonadales bacterium]MDG1442171.1 sulfatase-like hydrolase/transferase [Pseudomonadales bacterium]
MNRKRHLTAFITALGVLSAAANAETQPEAIQHDAEYYVLAAQNGKQWSKDDDAIDKKLAALREENGGKRPNILYILIDDMGFGSLGSERMNYVNGYKTPNINQMAKDGMSFMRMYSEPSCTPTRAALTTGRYAVRTGMNEAKADLAGEGLSRDEVTLAEVLSESGYNTVHVGKWHLGDIEEAWPHNQGFDYAEFPVHQQGQLALMHEDAEAATHVIGLSSGSHSDEFILDRSFRPNPAHLVTALEAHKGEKAKEVHIKSGEAWSEKKYRDMNLRYQTNALKQLQQLATKDEPFFLQYWPLYPLTFVKAQTPATSRNGGTMAESMQEVDGWIGELLGELDTLGIADNTLVVVMGDNGPFMQFLTSTGQSDRIYRGGKAQHLEGGVRVDAFARWPGVIDANSTVGDMIHVSDLFTSFARIADATDYIPRDRIIDGLDQSSLLLLGEHHGRRDYLYIYEGAVLKSVVKEHYKLHVPPPGQNPIAAPIFNLLRDPREERGLQTTNSASYGIWTSAKFVEMLQRHMVMKRKYPDRVVTRSEPYTGITNLRPETKALKESFLSKNAMLIRPRK